MAQILSNSMSTPTSVLPGASAAPAAVAGLALTPALAPANSGAADFVDQLKTALKNLTQATLPHVLLQVAPVVATVTAATEPAQAPADKADAKPVDKKSDLLPELLAALGFVPVPMMFQAPAPMPEKTAGGSATIDSDGSAAHPQGMQPLPKSVASELALSPNDIDAGLDLAKLPKLPVQLPLQEGQAGLAEGQSLPSAGQLGPGPSATVQSATAPRAQHGPPQGDAPAASASAAPTTQPVGADPSGVVVPPPIAVPLAAQHAAVPTVATGATVPVIGAGPQVRDHGGFQQGSPQGSADDGRQSPPKKTAPILETTSDQHITLSPNDLAIAAAAGSTAPNSVTVLPPHVRPAEVVAQIAHQADLYRLPGNRGVRIQLHPEGLGGVEVTMRYGVGGALQLHINVEHGATGALVQAGWAQLRDALATQGISPDRLIMSVSSPSTSSGLDFSGGGSGRQAEPGLAGFAQNQSGQQRQGDPDQTGPRGWNGTGEPASPSDDDNPRVTSTTAVTSRIDYRA